MSLCDSLLALGWVCRMGEVLASPLVLGSNVEVVSAGHRMKETEPVVPLVRREKVPFVFSVGQEKGMEILAYTFLERISKAQVKDMGMLVCN